MADGTKDPLTGLLTDQEEQIIRDFLGREAPVSTKGAASLPQGGALSSGSSPPSVGGTGIGPRGAFGITGTTTGESAGPPASSDVLKALKALGLAQNVAVIANKASGATGAPAVPVPSEAAVQGGDFGQAEAVGAGFMNAPAASEAADFGQAEAVGNAFTTGTDATSTGTSVGSVASTAAPFAGAAADIALTAARGNQPKEQQAINAALDVAAAALAGPTGGLSEVALPVVKADVARTLPDIEQGNLANLLAIDLNPAALPVALGLDLAGMFGFDIGPLFGGQPKTVKVQVPGYTEPIRQTLGGAKTSQKSYGEGLQGAQSFVSSLNGVSSLEQLATVLSGQYSPFPGQFRVNATTSAGEGVSNVVGGNYSRTFTAADLSDPGVLATLDVKAGALGAPADQPELTQAVKDAIRFMSQQRQQAAAPAPTPAQVAPKLPPAPPVGVSSGGGAAQAQQELLGASA